ncbi:MAG: TrbI/VirB10 family protein [Prosthecobacter sp.]
MLAQLQKPAVQMMLLLLVVAGAGVAFYVSKQPAAAVNAPPAAKADGKPAPTLVAEHKTKTLEENRTATIGSPTLVEPLNVPAKKPAPPSLVDLGTGPKAKTDQPPPPFPKLVHLSSAVEEPFVPSEPRLFAPRGVLIKAALVVTVDSSSLDTPVLGLVTEDLYWNQQLILPAGTQVHAKAGNGRTRDRIEVKGTYTFIWEDGREYTINGVALDHQRLADDTYAITDGSAGIRGQIIKNDQYAEVKIMIAEALQGVMNNNQQQFQSIYGLQPTNTSRNAALGGGSQAASAYSDLLTKKLDEDLDFVRVPAGTQFYIYTQDVFEPQLASVAGLRQGSQPVSSWRLAEETYARASAENAATSQKSALAAAQTEKASRDQRTAAQVQGVGRLISTPPTAEATPVPASPTTPRSNP